MCVFLSAKNVCSQRVKSCVQPNTGDLLSQAVNGGGGGWGGLQGLGGGCRVREGLCAL